MLSVTERDRADDMNLTEPDRDKNKQEERGEEAENFLQKPVVTKILLAVIALLLICILILLTIMTSRKNRSLEADSDLQQSITDYAEQQLEAEEQTLTEQEPPVPTQEPEEEAPEEEDEEE